MAGRVSLVKMTGGEGDLTTTEDGGGEGRGEEGAMITGREEDGREGRMGAPGSVSILIDTPPHHRRGRQQQQQHRHGTIAEIAVVPPAPARFRSV